MHLRNPALIEEVNDELQLMHTFEVRNFWLVAGVDQGLIAGHHQFLGAAAEHGLFAEEIGFGFFRECRLDQAARGAADAFRVRHGAGACGLGRVLMHCEQGWHAAPADEFTPHQIAGPFRRDEDNVHVFARLDAAVVD